MLYDLDLTLKALLEDEIPQFFQPEASTQVAISFMTPDAEFVNQLARPAVNLFLYDIQENKELRSSNWRVTRQNGDRANGNMTALKEPPLARVDCSYLITAWPRNAVEVEIEHQLLSSVMQVLMRYPKLPASALRGSLRHQAPPVRAKALGNAKLQSLGEFWQAIGGKPKATLSYSVTLAMPVHKQVQEMPLVLQTTINGADVDVE